MAKERVRRDEIRNIIISDISRISLAVATWFLVHIFNKIESQIERHSVAIETLKISIAELKSKIN